MPNNAQSPGHEWYQSAVIYELDVKNFLDSNGDGIGDFPGLTSRLDYLEGLGITCIWLQPFYATPDRDNGYDVSDFHQVNQRLGTLADFDAFLAEAKRRGLRVIADLPLNHCSDQHDWFQAARRDRSSPYRDYYIWSDELPENHSPYLIFGPEQGGNWEWDDEAGQYYFHTFYRFMPDFNMENPRVREELLKIVRFWMERGIDGFRLDAVPYLVHFRSEEEHLEEPHEFLRDLNKLVRSINPQAVLLAEANLKPKEMRAFFGDGDEMHLLLNFYLCNHIFLAVATGEARHIQRAWDELPEIPVECNWANFLRNHDELSLDQLTEKERQKVFEAFAPEKDMQLYDRGIRRRLAPMMDGHLPRIRLIYSLLLTLPGTPVINLGEEIGLGDDLRLKEREAGRTPMQWSSEPNAGFSGAPRERLYRPVVNEGQYAFGNVNVASQEKEPESLLNFFRKAIDCYKQVAAFGRGEWTFEKSGDAGVLVHRCDWQEKTAWAIHNLTSEPRRVRIKLPADTEVFLSDREGAGIDNDGMTELQPYGFRWIRSREAQ